MHYQSHEDIKARMKRLGLTARDLANFVGEPPGTVSSRLNGFIPMDFNQRRSILEWLRIGEAHKQLIQGEGK